MQELNRIIHIKMVLLSQLIKNINILTFMSDIPAVFPTPSHLSFFLLNAECPHLFQTVFTDKQ